MPSFVEFRVEERVGDRDDEWKRLCEAVIYRNGLDLADGQRPMIMEGWGYAVAVSAENLTAEQVDALATRLAREADELIKAARVTRALRTAEGIEQVRDSLTTTGRAVEALQTGFATAKTGAEYAALVKEWGPSILTAWAWIAPHLPNIVR